MGFRKLMPQIVPNGMAAKDMNLNGVDVIIHNWILRYAGHASRGGR